LLRLLATPFCLVYLDAGSGIIGAGPGHSKTQGTKIDVDLAHPFTSIISSVGFFPLRPRIGINKIHLAGANDPREEPAGHDQDVFFGSLAAVPRPPKAQIDQFQL